MDKKEIIDAVTQELDIAIIDSVQITRQLECRNNGDMNFHYTLEWDSIPRSNYKHSKIAVLLQKLFHYNKKPHYENKY